MLTGRGRYVSDWRLDGQEALLPKVLMLGFEFGLLNNHDVSSGGVQFSFGK